jgi:hypothetical protein
VTPRMMKCKPARTLALPLQGKWHLYSRLRGTLSFRWVCIYARFFGQRVCAGRRALPRTWRPTPRGSSCANKLASGGRRRDGRSGAVESRERRFASRSGVGVGRGYRPSAGKFTDTAPRFDPLCRTLQGLMLRMNFPTRQAGTR